MVLSSRTSLRSQWSSLPVELWPVQHRAAWEAAKRGDSPVRRGGRASTLSPVTQRILIHVYGVFLGWLKTTSNLDQAASPAALMTRELLMAFILERRRTVSDNSTFGNVRSLAMMMRCLSPELDWKWIWKNSATPRLSEARAARRPKVPIPAGLLLSRLLAAMAADMELPLERLRPNRIRDCLLVAFSVLSGLRVRNQAAMRLDHNLICRKEGWEVIFDGSEVKNGEAILFNTSIMLRPFLERYLHVDRPRLLSKNRGMTDAVWLSCSGTPLSKQGIALAHARIGQEMLGYPINPHRARHTLASRIIENDPRDINIASYALAHSDVSTASMFYDESGCGGAQKVWLQLVDDILAAPTR